jgi:hypothetical protein
MNADEFTSVFSSLYRDNTSDSEKVVSLSNSLINAFSACSILEVEGIIPSKSLRLAI